MFRHSRQREGVLEEPSVIQQSRSMERRLPCDRQQAERLLSLLANDDPKRLQVFLAYKDGRPAKETTGSLEERWAELQNLNNEGYAIAVTVNETDWKGRKAENIINIRAIWQDDDEGFEGAFPLEPSLVVETSPGKFQRYWPVEGDWPVKDDKGYPDADGEKDFKAVMRGMVEDYGSDASASDLARVLRLSGLCHLKGEPHLVKIIKANKKRYTRKELVAAFGKASSPPRPLDRASEPGDWEKERGRVLEALEFIPAEDREIWLKVGMAIHYASGGNQGGLLTWAKWSMTSHKFDPNEQRRTWNNFGEKSDPVTLGTLFKLAEEHGWEEKERPLEIERTEGDLASTAIEATRERFEGFGHKPAEKHWEGLEEIAKTIQAMSNQDPILERRFYLSSLPTGMGKTTVVVEAVKELLNREEYKDQGVVVFLRQVDFINQMIKDMELETDEYSVIVSAAKQEEISNLGNPVPKDARVLFTTQQMLERQLKDPSNGSFEEEVRGFFYRGQPRRVRIWDEAIDPARSLTLTSRDIKRLSASLEKHQEASKRLIKFIGEIEEEGDRAIVPFPEFSELGEEAINLMRNEEEEKACRALLKMQGHAVRVRRDQFSPTALTYETGFPEDMGPMLVLDASGEHRAVYGLWEKHRGGLRKLYSPPKRYEPLTIHHWNKGAGKSTLGGMDKKAFNDIAKGLAEKISELEGGVLVVHPKPLGQIPCLQEAIEDRIGISPNVKFLTWGRHTATNQFQGIKNVMLVGLNQYPTSAYEALARGSKGIPTEEELGGYDFVSIKEGEVMSNLFQAASRIAIRKAEGDSCPLGCNLYVIFSTKKDEGTSPDVLEKVFPGATVKGWNQFSDRQEKLKGIIIRLAIEPVTTVRRVRRKEVSDALGIGLNNLDYHLNEEFRVFMKEEEGIEIKMERGVLILLRGRADGKGEDDKRWE